MYDLMQNLQAIFSETDWPSIMQGVAGIWVAILATIALNTWRKQIKAQKHVDFLDELTDTIHAFILSMSGPVSSLKFAKIEIDSYSHIHKNTDDQKNVGAVEFIKKDGRFTRESIQKQLESVRPILSKMNSLVAKGQILGIKNYIKCQNACSMLECSYNQIEAFSSIIGNTNLNWENPEVQKTLDKILSVNSEQIDKNLVEQNSEYLLFARQAYQDI